MDTTDDHSLRYTIELDEETWIQLMQYTKENIPLVYSNIYYLETRGYYGPDSYHVAMLQCRPSEATLLKLIFPNMRILRR